MKNTLSFFFLIIVANFSLAQTYVVPVNVEFAGVVVKLDPAAQKLVQTDVNSLMANRRTLDAKLEKMTMFFPIVESVLTEEDVPNDFKYLCVQESSLIGDAVSSSNAVGFWQFKAETARDFGLRVDNEIDERKNIHAATRGACLYLKKNNAILNNWVSALNSYRLGLGGVSAIIPKDWAFASEIAVSANTDWYVLRALAHKIVFEQELGKYTGGSRLQLIDYKFNSGKSLEQIAQELEIDASLLRQYNLWLGGSNIPDDKEYMVTVPAANDQVEAIRTKAMSAANTNFIKNDIGFPVLKRVTPSLKDKTLPIFYEINGLAGILAQDGDSPLSLSMKANIRLDKFMDLNDMDDKVRIVPGEVYYLEKKARKAAVPFHTVSNDQTLWKISQIYGIRMKFLLKWNRLDQIVKLQPGRVVYLQKKRPKDSPVEYLNLPTQNPVPDKPIYKNDKNTKSEPTYQPNIPTEIPQIVEPTSPNVPATGSRRVTTIEEGANTANIPNTTPVDKPSNQQSTKVIPQPEYRPTTDKPVGINQEKQQNARLRVVTHTVLAGQTYFAVARQYGVAVQDVFAWNNVDANSPPPLKTGQKLKVYVISDGISPAQVPVVQQPVTAEPVAQDVQYHTVTKGDTAYSISKKYGITIEKLKELNNLGGTGISLGQRLKVQ